MHLHLLLKNTLHCMKTNERSSSFIRIMLYHFRRPNSKLSACFNPNYQRGTVQKLFSHPNLVHLSWNLCKTIFKGYYLSLEVQIVNQLSRDCWTSTTAK